MKSVTHLLDEYNQWRNPPDSCKIMVSAKRFGTSLEGSNSYGTSL